MVCVRHQNIELQDMLVVDYEEGLANIKRKSVLEGPVSGGELVQEVSGSLTSTFAYQSVLGWYRS